MVWKVASMEISLQPFVQGEGHLKCQHMLVRQWSIAVCFSGIHSSTGYPPCIPHVYIWCTAFGLTPGEVAAICASSPKHQLSSPQTAWKAGHKQLIVPVTLARRHGMRSGDGMANSQPAGWWNTTCSKLRLPERLREQYSFWLLFVKTRFSWGKCAFSIV